MADNDSANKKIMLKHRIIMLKERIENLKQELKQVTMELKGYNKSYVRNSSLEALEKYRKEKMKKEE